MKSFLIDKILCIKLIKLYVKLDYYNLLIFERTKIGKIIVKNRRMTINLNLNDQIGLDWTEWNRTIVMVFMIHNNSGCLQLFL